MVPSERCRARLWGQSLWAGLSLPPTAGSHPFSGQAGAPQSFLQELLDRRAFVQPFWGVAWYLLGRLFLSLGRIRGRSWALSHVSVSPLSQHNVSRSPRRSR